MNHPRQTSHAKTGGAPFVLPDNDHRKNRCTPSYKPVRPAPCAPSKETALYNAMRTAWEQHVYWTRMLLISIAENLNDQSAVTNRLLKNPKDIAAIFVCYYPTEAAKKIELLLTEHLEIGAKLITALHEGKTREAEMLSHQWYVNAEKMAAAFAGLNPYYKQDELREMLFDHLALTTQEVSLRLGGNYQADIAAFDKVEVEALSMADYFVSGLIRQFPKKF